MPAYSGAGRFVVDTAIAGMIASYNLPAAGTRPAPIGFLVCVGRQQHHNVARPRLLITSLVLLYTAIQKLKCHVTLSTRLPRNKHY